MNKTGRLTIIFIITILLAFVGCSSKDENKPTGKYNTIGESFAYDFVNKDFNNLTDNYDYNDKMKEAVGVKLYNDVYNQIKSKFGNYVAKQDITVTINGVYEIVTVILEYEKGFLNFNVVFDNNGLIAGFNYNVNSKYKRISSDEKQVTFGSEKFPLNGSIYMPKGEGPFPAMIIVHGSGPSDRNGSIGVLTPYADIAQGLVKKGIAVLLYDKRTFTHGKEIAENIEDLTVYEETIDDVVYAFEFLSEYQVINADKIFIAGHSMGGYLMPRIAPLIPGAAGFIVMAGNVTPLNKLIVKQYKYIFNLDNNISKDEQKQLDSLENMSDNIENIKDNKNLSPSELMNINAEYWLDLQGYNPVLKFKQNKKPTLIIQGKSDYQVTLDEYEKWKAGLSDMDNYTFKSYKGLNHAFTLSRTLTPDDYNNKGSVSVQVINDIANFILN